ncbi:c2-set_2 domain-containing protein [Trichonephila clavata]|uniref:C2-set_2 domain-containing protein n=1 Tax=Trichonephila clavata TaxID=2740835 RepID=A0A8X6I442_TRICU|nr:c2-set_2 domain-containing protein [Trichonephila clavata]
MIADCKSLKLRDFSVPAVVMRGDPVWLNCSYDLERDKLYSIKWHKNNVEFYRYLPADYPPGQKYELPGIFLDLGWCKEGYIFMSKTDVNSEGTYRCEVSTEAPFFRTVKGESEMRIYVNPSSAPAIVGVKNQYVIGETVNVTCISAPSRPQAFLKWWINDQEATNEDLYRPLSRVSQDGLFTSELILRFKARWHHFKNGRMKLVCEAIISQAHTLRSEEILVSNHSSSPQKTIFSDYGSSKDGPTISGGKGKYGVGDIVDINCTSAKSQPPAELHWYINDREAKPDYLMPLKSILYKNGMESTRLRLRFAVKHRHFQMNEMRLRCTATLSEVKTMSSEALEAEISEQQMSDLHVDFNTGAVSSKSLQRHEVYNPVWIVLLLYFFSRIQL